MTPRQMSHLVWPLTLTALTWGLVLTLILLAAARLICPFGTLIILGLSSRARAERTMSVVERLVAAKVHSLQRDD